MDPRQFTQWTIAVCFALLAILLIVHMTIEVFTQEYKVFGAVERVTVGEIDVGALAFAVLAGCISTFIVFLFGGTRGSIHFKLAGSASR